MNVLSRHWLISLGMLLCSSFLQGQQLLFTNPFKSILIPSQECYNIMQDSKGYIWFSTEAGLCRYDGTRLRVFDRNSILKDEAVYTLSEDAEGTIWMATSGSRIMRYRSGTLEEAPFMKAYRKFVEGNYIADPLPYFMDASLRDMLYISHRHFTVRINTKTNKIEKLTAKRNGANFIFAKFPPNRYVPFETKLAHNVLKSTSVQINHVNKTEMFRIPVDRFGNLLSWYTLSVVSGKTSFLGVHNVLLKVENNRCVGTFHMPERILSLYVDRKGGLWVGTYKNGLFYYPDIRTMKLGNHSLRTYSVTGMMEDYENGFWCTTLERGVFYTKNRNIVGYPDVDGLNSRMTLLKQIDNAVYASSGGDKVFAMSNDSYKGVTLPYPREWELSDIMKDDHGFLLGGYFYFVSLDENMNLRGPMFFNRESGKYQGAGKLIRLSDGSVFSCAYQYVCKATKKGWDYYYSNKYNIRCMLEGNRPGTILLGGVKGLDLLDLKTKTKRKIAEVKGNVVNLLRDRSNHIWVITKGDGVYWIDGDKVMRAGSQLDLPTRFFYDITEDVNGTIWLGSNSGLIRVRKENGGQYEVRTYGTRNGLLSNEVYKVATDNHYVYFSTFEGLCRFPLNADLRNTTVPGLHLHSLTVNDERRDYHKSPLKLKYHEKTLRFIFDVLTYKNSTDPHLIYTLETNGQKSTKKVIGTELLFENMVHGPYKLTVYGFNNDGVRSAARVFYFEIEHPFWQKWWFIASEVLLLFFMIYSSVRLIVGRIRKREEAKTDLNKLMAEYQMTALQAQMNPHFIFNAINTIQGYILNKNEQEAYNYLAKFSRLIRMVLQHSQERMHSLDRELEVLNLYIELEQLRFDNRFDYRLEINTEVDLHDCYLPGMLLQPYVENAIWHGLINLESRRGVLLIKISQHGENLLITIEDNGVGREMAKSFAKDRLHQSMAMKLNEQRLTVLNTLQGFEEASVTITDLCDPDDKPIGTRVDVVIPIN